MDWGQVVQALLIGAPSFLLGYLVYQRSRKVDAISAQSGIVTEARAGTAQIIDGLNKLIDNLQEDNASFRDDVSRLHVRLDACYEERNELRARFNRLSKRYGDAGWERAGDSPPFGTPQTKRDE